MKDLIREPAGEVPRGARRRAHLRPVRPHQHRRACGAVEEQEDQVRQHAARADRRARGRRLRAGDQARPSVVLSHLSPGLTNAATGVANAALDSIPMVVIAGDVPSHYYGKHPHQEVNLHADASQYEIYRPFVKRAWRVDSAHLFPEIIEKAFALAESGRPGPVLVDVPMDIFSKEIDVKLFERLRAQHQVVARSRRSTTRPRTEIVTQAAQPRRRRCSTSAAASCSPTRRAEMREFVEHLSDAGRAHADGQGALPDDHPLDPRHDRLLGHEVHQRQVPAAPTGSWGSARASRGRLQLVGDRVHVQLPADEADPHRHRPGRDRPQLSGRRSAPSPISRQALTVLNRVARKLAPTGRQAARARQARWRPYAPAVRRRQPEGACDEQCVSDAARADPRRRARGVCRATRSSCTDVGWNKNGVGAAVSDPTSPARSSRRAATRRWASAPRRRWARRWRCPDRVVVALVGDGGFGQNPAMLATAFEEDIAVVWVIMNNFAFGTIAGLEKAHFGTTFGTVFEKDGKPWSPDYAAIAKAYGIDGVKIRPAAEFKPALEKADQVEASPFVIDVEMQNEPVPTAGSLEHHGHLLAGQEGASRQHQRRGACAD